MITKLHGMPIGCIVSNHVTKNIKCSLWYHRKWLILISFGISFTVFMFWTLPITQYNFHAVKLILSEVQRFRNILIPLKQSGLGQNDCIFLLSFQWIIQVKRKILKACAKCALLKNSHFKRELVDAEKYSILVEWIVHSCYEYFFNIW